MDKTFGIRLKRLRKEYGLTQKELAKALSVSNVVISSYELCARYPTIQSVIKAARFFNVTADYLLGLDDMHVISVEGLQEHDYTLIKKIIKSLAAGTNKRTGTSTEAVMLEHDYPNRLRELRESRSISQYEMAKSLGVHQTTYGSYETGKLAIPLCNLVKLADYYGTSIDYLVGRTDNK